VIDAVEKEDMSCRAAARLYKISPSAAVKWMDSLSSDRLKGAKPSTRSSALCADATPRISECGARRKVRHHAKTFLAKSSPIVVTSVTDGSEILARPQPHRAGLPQTQNSDPKGRSQNLRRPLRRSRQDPSEIFSTGVRRLPQELRVCV